MSLIIREIDGVRVGFILADVPDAAPQVIREGLARRALTASTGQCPCGAEMVFPNRAERRRNARLGRITHVNVEHENGCPAIDSTMLEAIEEWRR